MAVLLALIATIAIASICQAAPVSDPHHILYRHPASGPLHNNRQSQFEVNLPGFLRVSGQHNYPYGYQPVQTIVPYQPQQQQRWLPSKFPFSGFNPATAISPLCLPCSNTTWSFANQRSPQNRLLFPSFSINGAGTNTNNQGSSSTTDWMNWWTNPLGFLFPQNPVPQLPTLPFWTSIFCCNSTNNNTSSTGTTTTTTTAIPPTTVVPPTTTLIPPTTTLIPPTTTTLIPPTTTTLIPPTTTTLIPPTTTTLIPPTTTTLIPPTTTLIPPTTTTLIPPTTTTLIPPTTPTTTTLIPPTTTTLIPPTTSTLIPPTTPTTTTAIPPPTTTPPPERSLESGTNKESLPTDTIPNSGLKLLMNLFPPSYISFVRR